MSQSTVQRSRWQPNPILVKEVRSQLRGGRAFILLTGLLLGLGAIGYGLFLLATSGEQHGQIILSAQIGQTLFGGLVFTLLIGVCVIAPAITVGAISSEYERLTYEMLVATRLTPARILWGKLVAALSYVALLLLAAVPLGSIVFLFGGLTLLTVIKALVLIILTAITAAMLGLWASALIRHTARAAIAAYLLITLVVGGLLFSSYVWTLRTNSTVPLELVTPNPVSAMASILAPLSTGSAINNGFPPPPMAFPGQPGGGMMRDAAWGFGGPFMGQISGGIDAIPGWRVLSIGVYPAIDPNQAALAEPRGLWRTTIIIEILACLGLFWMSLHLVRPRQRWRLGWQDLGMLSFSALTLLGLGVWRGWW